MSGSERFGKKSISRLSQNDLVDNYLKGFIGNYLKKPIGCIQYIYTSKLNMLNAQGTASTISSGGFHFWIKFIWTKWGSLTHFKTRIRIKF
jgi:hypothetical protein